MTADILICGHPCLDQSLPVPVSFGRQLHVNCSAGFCLSLRHKSFLSHCLNGPVHDRSVETQERGNLILIEHNAAPECRQDEAASRRAAGLSLKPLAHGKIGCGNMG